jgi:hypothetical protein
MLVVDTQRDSVTVGWYDEGGTVQEISLPPACLHRVSPL